MIISEELVHTAVNYMTTMSNAAAEAKGNLVRAEYHRKRIRAQLILASDQKSQGLREAFAEAHDDYAEVCEKLAKCEREYEWHRNERSKCDTVCEMWRTEQATMRGLRRVA